MKRYTIKITPEAFADIQQIINWYNNQQKGLGARFRTTVVRHLNSLNKDPQIYAIRYKEIRCVVIKNFPYMAHFYIDDETKTVEVLAIISTSRNPKIWQEKTGK